MTEKSANTGLILSIIFASVIISASLIFFALQIDKSKMTDGELELQIEKGIENYIQKVQDDYEKQNGAAPEVAEPVVYGDLTDDDAILGNPDAPITIVEFSDYQCPYCRVFFNDTYPMLKEKYIDTGKAKLVFRDYPLSFHKDAQPAAIAAECVRDEAGDEAYFKMHDMIFEGQNKKGTGTVAITEEELAGYADELGANLSDYNSCIADESMVNEVLADLAAGGAAGVSGTPSFVVNGKFLEGAQPFSEFEILIEGQLAEL